MISYIIVTLFKSHDRILVNFSYFLTLLIYLHIKYFYIAQSSPDWHLVTVVELLPRPGDEDYLPGLVDRTNELIGNYMSNNGYDHDVLKVKNMKEEHFVDGVHLNRRGFDVLMGQLAAWCI